MQTTTSNDWDLYRFASVTVETGVKGRQMVLGHDRADCAMATGQRLSPVEVTETPWPCACVGVVVDRLPSAVFAAPSEVAGVQYVKPGDRLDGRSFGGGSTPAPRPSAQPSVRANKYPGNCSSCGGYVAAEAGQLGDKVDGRWTVKHTGECPAQAPAASQPVVTGAGTSSASEMTQTLAEVLEGRYAVDTEAGHLGFYKVDRPTEGKWAGWTFVKVQAGPEWHPVKSRATKAAILAKIAADPKGAMLRYGVELGHCGHCGRELTDETSRAYGIGPVCRAKMAW
jgi:hypothetical protein